jgi:hypothetical protein
MAEGKEGVYYYKNGNDGRRIPHFTTRIILSQKWAFLDNGKEEGDTLLEFQNGRTMAFTAHIVKWAIFRSMIVELLWKR